MSDSDSKSRNAASRRLHAMDSVAEFVVTTGGFVVLAAVLGICFYLLWVVLPLFSAGKLEKSVVGHLDSNVQPEFVLLDPYIHSATAIDQAYSSLTFGVADGKVGIEYSLNDVGVNEDSPERHVTAMSFARNGAFVAVGFDDGWVSFGELGYSSKPITIEQDADHSDTGMVYAVENGYIERLEDGRGRRVEFGSALGDPVELKGGSGPVVAVDYRKDPTGKEYLAALREDGTVLVNSIRTTRPLGGGTPRTKLRTKEFELNNSDRLPDWFFVTADGKQVFCVWEDGQIDRYAKPKGGKFGLIEQVFTVDDQQRSVSVVQMLLGGQTLMLGFSDGLVETFHVADDKTQEHADSMMLVRSHRLESKHGEVLSIAPSERDRTIAVLHADGFVVLRHLTSSKLIKEYQSGIAEPGIVAISPKNDAIFVLGNDGSYALEEMDFGYPEFSMTSLFGRVHFEGVAEPEFVYQSSSGDDASEIKLSLMPLIFGTLKATVFAMLFAIPIAVLAAIYSSEFVSKRVRKKVKPAVELMASLPSVVLGFIAAFVAAPFVEAHLDSFVLGLIVVPVAVLLGAHLWQLVPLAVRLRMRTGQHLLLVGLAVSLGFGASLMIGPLVVKNWFAPDAFDSAMLAGDIEDVPVDELPSWAGDAGYNTRTARRLRRLELGVDGGVVVRATSAELNNEVLEQLSLEHGDLQRWLNDEYGRARPGWAIAFFPVVCFVVWALQALFLRRKLDLLISESSGLMGSVVVLGKFVVLLGVSLAISMLLARVVEAAGFDPRDSVFGPFSPRNTLVVAGIMGFAVIPIIYTISEDALQAVPMTLRTASLGAGATPWQTAMRVVMPVAASGIFSACMIGFGRAVGETMIVLMATGNTPEMDWNIFSGFRTLAANIAVELPEAPKDETHYRVLFLCGLVLFLMTFVINTLAELVRRVVRARNAGL